MPKYSKDLKYWMELTDPFYKSPASIKAAKDREAKRMYWVDKNLDADPIKTESK